MDQDILVTDITDSFSVFHNANFDKNSYVRDEYYI